MERNNVELTLIVSALVLAVAAIAGAAIYMVNKLNKI